MTFRTALWALAGLLIAGSWALYAALTTAPRLTFSDPIMPLIESTCPIVAASIHLRFGVSLFWALVANTATYALAGLLVETLRVRLRHAR